MAYIGRSPQYGAFEKQVLTADGSTTTFTLNYTVGSSSSILVSVAGVHQEPEVAYNLANGGTQIVFTAAPAALDTVFVIFLGVALEVATIGTGIITSQTELTQLAASDDLLLIYDTSAGMLKKIQKSNVAADIADGSITGAKLATPLDLSSTVITAPKIANGGFIADANGNEQIKFTTTASAINEITVTNAAIGNAPSISTTGGDTNISLTIAPKGTGDVLLDTDTVRIGDSNVNAILTTNGTGDITISTNSGTNSGTIKIFDGVNGNIEITPNGTGVVKLDGLSYPTADGTANQVLQTNGSGVISFATPSAGGTSWQAVKTSGFTAVAGEGYFCNTTSAAFTVTLPASPTIGQEVSIIDYAGTFDTNNLTVARNGKNIQGLAEDLTVSIERSAFTLVFTDNTQGWLLRNK